MLAPMLMLKKVASGGGLNSIPPLLGYNYSDNVSTGKIAPTSRTAGAAVAPPIAIAGYASVMKGVDTVTYAAGSRTGVTDFTAMTRVLLVGATSYVTILGSGFTIRTGDSGFGNRLQFGYAMSTIATCWDSSVTESQMSSAWYHIAFVRRSNVNTIYINGSAIMLANGTGSSYTNASFSDATSVASSSPITVGQSGVNVYTAEWGFWDSAIITANFIPPAGGLV